VLLLLARMDRRGSSASSGFIASLGVGFVAVVALSPVVQPWYLLWGFILIAAGTSNFRSRTAVIAASAALAVVVMPKGGTVDVSAIIQAVLCAAVVVGAAALFELLPGRAGLGEHAHADRPAPEPVPRAVPKL
jgi:alpha-1,6-mannosyltransferase